MTATLTPDTRCPVCGGADLAVFFELPQVPVHIGVQWPSAQEARQCPRGDMQLAVCATCSFITNTAFRAEAMEYAYGYENALSFSGVHRDYTLGVAKRLVDRYQLYGKDIIEIGCGRGDFLSLLCSLGNNRGVGFDPSANGEDIDPSLRDRITMFPDYFSEGYSQYRGDLICCRHVFEHIPDPVAFLETLRGMVEGRAAVLYFEVPNISHTLRKFDVWELIYEHCSHFSAASLARVFTRCGFDVREILEPYAGQFLTIEATHGHEANSVYPAPPASTVLEAAAHFQRSAAERVADWRRILGRLTQERRRVALWGGGARGVGFLNVLQAGDAIPYVVDINPRKSGKYVPGTGQPIVPPEFLREFQPDVIISTNAIYKDEIETMARGMGLRAEFLYA